MARNKEHINKEWELIQRCFHATNIPYLTDDTDKLQNELKNHIENNLKAGVVQKIICPFGGTVREAIIVFKDMSSTESCEKVSSSFKNLQLKALPPVFSRMHGTLESFYWQVIPKNKSKILVKDLSSISEKVEVAKDGVTEVICQFNQVGTITNCIVEKVLGEPPDFSLPQQTWPADIIEHGIFMEDVTYLTDDPSQLKSELRNYFEHLGYELPLIICRIKGDMSKAIVVFKTLTDKDSCMKRDDFRFHGDHFKVTSLLPIFVQVKATIDQFYFEYIPEDKLKQMHTSICKHCGSDVKRGSRTITGTQNEIGEVLHIVLETFALRSPPKDTIPKQMATSAVKQDLSIPDQVRSDRTRNSKSSESSVESLKVTEGEDAQYKIEDDITSSGEIITTYENDNSEKGTNESKESTINDHEEEKPLLSDGQPRQTNSSKDVIVSGFVLLDDKNEPPTHKQGVLKEQGSDTQKRGKRSTALDGKVVKDSLKNYPGVAKPAGEDLDERTQGIHLQHVKDREAQTGCERGTHSDRPKSVKENAATPKKWADDAQPCPKAKVKKGIDTQVEKEQTQDLSKNDLSDMQCDITGETPESERGNDDKSILTKHGSAQNFTRGQNEVGANPNNMHSKPPNTNRELESSRPDPEDLVHVKMPIFEYIKRNRKSEFDQIQESHKVKITSKTTDPAKPFDQIVKIKPQRWQSNQNDTLSAKKEFIELYSKTLSQVVHISLDCTDADSSKIKKAKEMIKSKFSDVTFVSKSGTKKQYAFCADEESVNDAITEFKISAGMYQEQEEEEPFTVDKIVYKYMVQNMRDRLNAFEEKYNVSVELQASTNEVRIRPKIVGKQKQKVSTESIQQAKEDFITLYQDTFFSIKRIQLSCDEVSSEVLARATEGTKQKYRNVVIVPVDNSEYVICSDAEVFEGAVKEFRTISGLLKNRKLKKGSSTDADPDNQTLTAASDMKTIQTLDSKTKSASSEPPSAFVTKEGLQLIVLQDDLTKQQVNCIVSSSDCFLSNTSGVARAILKAAGVNLQKECEQKMDSRQKKAFPVGECFSTKGYDLPCDVIVHAVGPIYTRGKDNFTIDLTKTFLNILEYVNDKLHVKTVAIPLIGSGNSSSPRESCTKALGTALLNFSKTRKRKYLEQVFLINIDAQATMAIQKTFAEMFPPPIDGTSKLTLKKTPSSSNQFTFTTDEGLHVNIAKSDITKVKVNVIVNAANGLLKHGGGVAKAISKAAGQDLQKESNQIMLQRRQQPFKVGEVVATNSYDLPCDKVLHAVGPRRRDCSNEEDFYRSLKSTYIAVLKYANISMEANTLAIPLISSGIFGGSKHVCAKALAEAVMEFSSKEANRIIKIVYLLNIDEESTQALQSTFQQSVTYAQLHQTEAAIEAKEEFDYSLGFAYQTKEGIILDVVKGDITTLDVDVIVNPTDNAFLNNGGTSRAILKAAGSELRKECESITSKCKSVPLKLYEIIETNAFDLPCRHVLHIVSPLFISNRHPKHFYEPLQKTFLTCLKHANGKSKAKSLAIPLIGSGGNGGPKEICATALAKAVKEMSSKEKPLFVKRIVLVNLDHEATLAVQMCLEDEFGKLKVAKGIDYQRLPIDFVHKEPVKIYQTEEKLQLVIRHADVSEQEADVLVNCTDDDVNNTEGMSKATCKVGGPEMQKEFRQIIKHRRTALKPGEYIATKGHILPCRNVIHLHAGPTASSTQSGRLSSDDLQRTLLNMLFYAETTLNAKTVGFSLDDIARHMSAEIVAESIKRFSRRHQHMTTIFFVYLEHESLTAVTEQFSKIFEVVSNTKENASSCTLKHQALIDIGVGEDVACQQRGPNSTLKSTFLEGQKSSPSSQRVHSDSSNPTVNVPRQQQHITKHQNMSGNPKKDGNSATNQNPLSEIGDNTSQKRCKTCYLVDDIKTLEGCGHTFCETCITKNVAPNSKCLVCSSLYCRAKETKYHGTMTYFIQKDLKIPGEANNGAIVIKYDIPSGKQGPKDPQPGANFRGASKTAYLPNTAEAQEVVWLLRSAFVTGLLFEIQRTHAGFEVSLTRKIPHKLHVDGGVNTDGYPDVSFTQTVKQVLNGLGFKSAEGRRKSSRGFNKDGVKTTSV